MRPRDDTGGHRENGGKIKHMTINHKSKEGDFNNKVDYDKKQHIEKSKNEKDYDKE